MMIPWGMPQKFYTITARKINQNFRIFTYFLLRSRYLDSPSPIVIFKRVK